MATIIDGSGSADFHTPLPVAEGGTGVTASTGSGNVVLSASPTLTGTVSAAALTLTTPLPVASGGTGSATGASSITLGTVAATTSGTSIDFTGIPSGVKCVVVMFNGVSTNGVAKWRLQIGTSGGLQTSGYLSTASYDIGGGFNDTAGFAMYHDAAADLRHGHLTLNLLDSSNGTWCLSGLCAWSNRAYILPSVGTKILSGTLDRVRLTTANGTDAFDAGSVNISWEF